MQPRRQHYFWLSAVLGLALFATGCKVSAADVDTWKGTRKGPGKMVAVILADKFELPLRTYAAIGLVAMDRQDLDGVTELQNTLQKLAPETREKIADGLADGLVELMKKPADQPSADGSPPPHQVRAKDAGFMLANNSTPAVREKLTAAVVGWYTADFNGRNLVGSYSAEQVVRGLGATAAKSLVDALSSKLPQAALVKLAELIGQLGAPEVKQKAGQKLTAIEREMEGDVFLGWLKGQIADQMKASGTAPDAARVEKAALLNRENFIETGAIPAMKYLADQPEVAARLLEIAQLKDPKLTTRRTRALQALEGKVGSAQLDALLAIALDPTTPVGVRDYAFDRVGDIRDPKAIPAMWPLVQSATDQRLRWRVGELVLAIGGNTTLAEFFAKLPPTADFEPEELEGYAQRMSQMTPAPRDYAAGLLRSANWWESVVGLQYFARKGTDADAAQMTELTRSSAATKGKHWGERKTVGKVAETAITALKERLKDAAAAGG
jgi:hypothetical protein